ncbi:MAG: hypothetical protein ACRDTF_10435 [Pseudonocardiaceae bacterium]
MLALAAGSLQAASTFEDDAVARRALGMAALPVSRLPHDGPVNAVVFSPDGTQLATASDDGTARLSLVDPDLLLNVVEQRIPRPLTDAEWERYGGRPISQHDTGIARSTVSVDKELLATARQCARLRGQTVGQFVEDSLRRELGTTSDTEDR